MTSPMPSVKCSRRSAIAGLAAALASSALPGCSPPEDGGGSFDAVWGRHGTLPGRLNKPRGVTIDRDDNLYIVDFTPRIHVFTCDGDYLRGWRTPEYANGRPQGLSFDRDGHLLVSDTHYCRVLAYTPDGKLIPDKTIGGTYGSGPDEFEWITDCIQDAQGNYFISSYGDFDQIHMLGPDRKFSKFVGKKGSGPGEFRVPRKLSVDRQGLLWIADACNHRIQVFDPAPEKPRLVRMWGQEGFAPGQLRYPYDLLLDDEGHVYVCEYGNHRVQKFTSEGVLLGWWGVNGRRPGQLVQPWGITQDSQGRMYVLDSYNHRVQRFWL
jgi:sugar lactone lactonase YvrE